MNERIISLATLLNEEINNNPKVKRLEELDKAISDSFDVYELSKKKDELLEIYINNKEIYGEDNELTISSLKNLKDAKEKLQNYPLVKEYLSTYSEVRDIYMKVNEIVLGGLVEEKSCQ